MATSTSFTRRLAIGTAAALITIVGAATPARAEAGGTITGRVTAADGSPAVATTVRVTHEFGGNPMATTTTDSTGTYRFETLAVGRYRLEFRAAGSNLTQYPPQQRDWFSGTVFEVAEGATVVVDETLLATGTITGRITVPSGPASNVGLSFYSVGTFFAIAFTQTAADGTYQAAVFVGDYQVSIGITSQLKQWVPGKRVQSGAAVYPVAAGGTTVVDDTLLPLGSISGQLLDNDGTPEAQATVFVSYPEDPHNGLGVSTTTDDAGRYTLPSLIVGDYYVAFRTADFSRGQYAYQADSIEAAARITVNTGLATVVNDTLLPFGNLEIRVTDSVSGAPINEFCAYAEGYASTTNGCTDNGVLTFTLPGGSYWVIVWPDELHHFTEQRGVVVAGNTTTRKEFKVRPAAVIATTVVDAATGEPVADTCFEAYTLRFGGTGEDFFGWCSDAEGKVRIGMLDGGKYNLFALPRDDVHGAQWVGPDGGTGSQYKARIVNAPAGRVTEVPPVKLDRAGSISGVITDEATGAGIEFACAAFLPFDPGPGGNGAYGGCTDSAGRYTISGLGPYDWPIEFISESYRDGYAWEWSGNATNRLVATPVRVSVGQTATANAALAKGTKVTGKVLDANGQPLTSNVVQAYNVLTGDAAGAFSQDGPTYELAVRGNQLVHLSVWAYNIDLQFWYNRAKTVDRATPVFIPAHGTKTVDLRAPKN